MKGIARISSKLLHYSQRELKRYNRSLQYYVRSNWMLFGLKPSSRMGRLFAVSQPSAAIRKTKQNKKTKQKQKNWCDALLLHKARAAAPTAASLLPSCIVYSLLRMVGWFFTTVNNLHSLSSPSSHSSPVARRVHSLSLFSLTRVWLPSITTHHIQYLDTSLIVCLCSFGVICSTI